MWPRYDYYHCGNLFKEYPTGSAMFLPKRSMSIKNKRRKKRRS